MTESKLVPEDSPADVCNRLRGIIIIPVNDGAGLLDGKDYFERHWPDQPALHHRAAVIIEELVAGQTLSWTVVNEIALQLLEPDDPFGTGKKYIVPIRQKAAWMIHDLRQALDTDT